MFRNAIVALVINVVVAGICPAQEVSRWGDAVTESRVEFVGTAATGENTPFWLVSNRYGVVPLTANNGYLRGAVQHSLTVGANASLTGGIDVVASTTRYRNVFIQQLFAELSYGRFLLSVGSRERYTSLWDSELSSGDLVTSSNARPIPGICLSVPQFTVVPFTNSWLQFKGDFGVGRSFDEGYLNNFYKGAPYYIVNSLWHNKSLHLRVFDVANGFPLLAVVGLRHHVQWGGVSNSPEVGVQPHSLRDFVRVMLGQGGAEDASISDQINVLGNHYGSYDFKLGWVSSAWSLYLYRQHYYEDESGLEFLNNPDGLYGVQVNLPRCSYLGKIVIEYVHTLNQSGPVHFLDYDHTVYGGYGNGADDYYNNWDYGEGVSYFNRGTGTPLVRSPEYDRQKRQPGFNNNRIVAYHAGVSGCISSRLAYRLLATTMETYGTPARPLLSVEKDISFALRLSYCHPRLKGWQFNCELAHDKGAVFGNSTGIGLSVSKEL
jgi:hypothetical protein